MNAEHEKEIVKEADAFERGQSSPSADYEKGARDQDFKTSQVGQINDRKGEGARSDTGTVARSFWFDDATKEIGAAACSTQFEFGRIYRRSETGHRLERTAARGSVSKLHSSEARPL